VGWWWQAVSGRGRAVCSCTARAFTTLRASRLHRPRAIAQACSFAPPRHVCLYASHCRRYFAARRTRYAAHVSSIMPSMSPSPQLPATCHPAGARNGTLSLGRRWCHVCVTVHVRGVGCICPLSEPVLTTVTASVTLKAETTRMPTRTGGACYRFNREWLPTFQ